ncbi:MAG: type IV secretory system conjugative DNA transfer family protein [Balneola sp.]
MSEFFNYIGSYFQVIGDLLDQLYTLPFYVQGFYILTIISLSICWHIVFVAEEMIFKMLACVLNACIVFSIASLIGNYLYVVPGFLELPSIILAASFYPFRKIKIFGQKENIYILKYQTDKGPIYIDLRRHGGIFGGSGAGKTDSGYIPVIKHMFKYGLPGSVYDYKDFELWEKVLYFAEKARKSNIQLELTGVETTPLPELRCIYFKDPNFSDHFNFLDPQYIQEMEDVEAVCNTFFDNLYPGDGDGNFFKESGSSIMAGVTWRMKEDYPEYCDFPHISQIILNSKGKDLMSFIQKSSRASALAAPFLKAKGNEKQIGSVISSVAAAMKKIATPNMYQVLSKNDFDIAINKEGNHTVLGLINVPSRDSVYGPVLATIAQLMMNKMSERNRQYSIHLWDEASTLKFNRLDKILATLRSFKISIIWGLQDKVQGVILYNENVLKAILANLGMKIIGKANDSDTAQYYTKLFETIDVKERSVSESDRGKTTTTSIREKSKYKQFDFQRLKQGEFFFIDTESRDKRARVKLESYENIKPEQKHFYTKEEIENNYDRIVYKAKEILLEDLQYETSDEPDETITND